MQSKSGRGRKERRWSRSGFSVMHAGVLTILNFARSRLSDLALRLTVGGHASTGTCLVEPSCSRSLSCFTHVWHRFLGCRSQLLSRVSSFVCILFSRGASLCPGVHDSSVDSVCSSFRAANLRCFQLCCAALWPCSSSGQTPVCPVPSGSSEPVTA